jgi:hypothetical protein
MGRIQDFLAAALAEQVWTFRMTAVGLIEVVNQACRTVARFKDDRERAMATDGLGLLGVAHPLVASQLAKWRSTPLEGLGSELRQAGDESGVLRWWMCEGWSGVRTHDTNLTHTRFPGARLRPIGHPPANDISVTASVQFPNAAPHGTQRCPMSGPDRLAPDKPRQVQAIQGIGRLAVSPALPRKNKIAYTEPPVVGNEVASQTLDGS